MISEFFLTEKFEIPVGVNVPPFASIAKKCNFTVLELKRMFGRFCALANSTGRVDKTAFLRQPELAFCSFADLAFDYEQEKTRFKVGPGETWPRGLDFVQFVTLFSAFSPLSPMEDRLNCKEFIECFRISDSCITHICIFVFVFYSSRFIFYFECECWPSRSSFSKG